jgi:hypothetical protein
VSSVRVTIVGRTSTDDVVDKLKQTIELVNRAVD